MMRSMFSGISGLRAHQVKMDVIGNNISNVNTVGFKASRVTFQEVLNQTIQPAFGASTATSGVALGGVNAQQIGLGVAVGSIDVLHNTAGAQRTDRPLDVAINGDGFFIVTDGAENFYTRAGNFYLDNEGNLVTQSGYKVCDGSTPPAPIKIENPTQYAKISIGTNGQITGTKATDSTDATTTLPIIGLANFPNPAGLIKDGSNFFKETRNSGAAKIGQPGTSSTEAQFSTLMSSTLEMSNVDLSQEFTDMIIAQRGFQANAKVITTSNDMLQELTQIIR